MSPLDLDDDDCPTETFRPDFAALVAIGRSVDGVAVPPAPRVITKIPPPLPILLRKRLSYGDEEWLASLSAEQREILTTASQPATPWPYAERIPGAVCTPIDRAD
ncbi:MAG: hypothetical protein U0234_33265 [Sandaracinus sp.]